MFFFFTCVQFFNHMCSVAYDHSVLHLSKWEVKATSVLSGNGAKNIMFPLEFTWVPSVKRGWSCGLLLIEMVSDGGHVFKSTQMHLLKVNCVVCVIHILTSGWMVKLLFILLTFFWHLRKTPCRSHCWGKNDHQLSMSWYFLSPIFTKI